MSSASPSVPPSSSVTVTPIVSMPGTVNVTLAASAAANGYVPSGLGNGSGATPSLKYVVDVPKLQSNVGLVRPCVRCRGAEVLCDVDPPDEGVAAGERDLARGVEHRVGIEVANRHGRRVAVDSTVVVGDRDCHRVDAVVTVRVGCGRLPDPAPWTTVTAWAAGRPPSRSLPCACRARRGR